MFFLEILVDLRGQDPSQDGPKTLPNAPKTPPRRSQDAPRCSQDASRRLQNAPRCPQDTPRLKSTPKNLPKTSPDPLQDWFFRILASIFDDFLMIFQRFWWSFLLLSLFILSSILLPFCIHFYVSSWLLILQSAYRARSQRSGGGGDSPQASSIDR